MKRNSDTAFFVLLLLVAGCANINIPFVGKSSEQSKAVNKTDLPEKPSLEPSAFVEDGRIINAQRLQQGQNIVIIPFKAGVGVEATEELDKAALMLVKGISDAFGNDPRGEQNKFNILTAESVKEAEFIIQGHITDQRGSPKIKKWVLLKGTKTLGVEGKMTDAQTGETIAIFSDHAKTSMRKEDYKQLGYRIGKNIGQFILSGIPE